MIRKIHIRDISPLEQDIRSLFNPDWDSAGPLGQLTFPHNEWDSITAKQHLSLVGSVLGDKIVNHIKGNITIALVDPSPYVRIWAQHIKTL